MRTVTLIVVHCSANRAGSALRLADIDRYHRSLGWKGCGYHYVVATDGTVEAGRKEAETGAHCRNHNRHSIGVCYVGGLSEDCRRREGRRTHGRTHSARPCGACWRRSTGDIRTP